MTFAKKLLLCRGLLILGAIAQLMVSAPRTMAWGCKGHQTVAYLAEKHMTPEAKELVGKILSENPVDPALKRYCALFGLDAMAESSTWADDERAVDTSMNPWHYIDVPLGASREQVAASCGAKGCVTRAITEQLAILKDGSAAGEKRAKAIRLLIHFVGDLHQPLHDSTNDDHGGNCVPVKYFWRTPQERRGSYSPNLHSVWDTEIIEREMAGAGTEEYAAALEQKYAGKFAEWERGGIRLDDWVWEGHELAKSVVYGGLEIPREPEQEVKTCADDNHIGERMMAKDLEIGARYQGQAGPIAEERIAEAGIHLAMVLNEGAKGGSAAGKAEVGTKE